jgi:hypothetical protein
LVAQLSKTFNNIWERERVHISEMRRSCHVTSGGWESTVGGAQSVPSNLNVGERCICQSLDVFESGKINGLELGGEHPFSAKNIPKALSRKRIVGRLAHHQGSPRVVWDK